jgi:hypothetical protein
MHSYTRGENTRESQSFPTTGILDQAPFTTKPAVSRTFEAGGDARQLQRKQVGEAKPTLIASRASPRKMVTAS